MKIIKQTEYFYKKKHIKPEIICLYKEVLYILGYDKYLYTFNSKTNQFLFKSKNKINNFTISDDKILVLNLFNKDNTVCSYNIMDLNFNILEEHYVTEEKVGDLNSFFKYYNLLRFDGKKILGIGSNLIYDFNNRKEINFPIRNTGNTLLDVMYYNNFILYIATTQEIYIFDEQNNYYGFIAVNVDEMTIHCNIHNNYLLLQDLSMQLYSLDLDFLNTIKPLPASVKKVYRKEYKLNITMNAIDIGEKDYFPSTVSIHNDTYLIIQECGDIISLDLKTNTLNKKIKLSKFIYEEIEQADVDYDNNILYLKTIYSQIYKFFFKDIF